MLFQILHIFASDTKLLVHIIFSNANNALSQTTRTGKRRKTYYSISSMGIKKMLRECALIRNSWKRRVEATRGSNSCNMLPANPFLLDPARGQNRGGKHVSGDTVSLQEMKKRRLSLRDHTFKTHYGDNTSVIAMLVSCSELALKTRIEAYLEQFKLLGIAILVFVEKVDMAELVAGKPHDKQPKRKSKEKMGTLTASGTNKASGAEEDKKVTSASSVADKEPRDIEGDSWRCGCASIESRCQ